MTRIAFVAPPFAGHLNPLLELVEAARDAGHEVSVITGARKRAAVAARGLATVTLDCLEGPLLEAIADTAQPVRSHPLRLLAQLRRSLAVARLARDELLALWRVDPPDLVVADSVAVSAGLAATALGLPWITTIATPFAIEGRRGPPSYLGGWGAGDGPLHRLRDAAGWRFVRTMKTAFALATRRELAALGARLYRPDGSETCYSPTAILGFGLTELEFARDWPAAFAMIGPLYRHPEAIAPVPLPPGRPRVLVTLGTHLPWAKATLANDIGTLAAARPGVTFVGSLGTTDPSIAAQSVADNAVLLPFVPYDTQLAAFDAVIHHGGAGVTYATIAAGKPAVVVPHDYDQFDFAARIVAMGAGLRAARLASTQTLAALDRALQPQLFPALPALAHAAARYRPREAFLAAVDSAVGGRPAEIPG
ncbi:glycosyltransferase [Bradyrhizobium sp. 2TAF24]|uniref:glycosyltransferase n=1 Tax=Bradyrhizobium sp. 2TAF24 TaxID=3233011 RepID=UPI003F9184CA